VGRRTSSRTLSWIKQLLYAACALDALARHKDTTLLTTAEHPFSASGIFAEVSARHVRVRTSTGLTWGRKTSQPHQNYTRFLVKCSLRTGRLFFFEQTRSNAWRRLDCKAIGCCVSTHVYVHVRLWVAQNKAVVGDEALFMRYMRYVRKGQLLQWQL